MRSLLGRFHRPMSRGAMGDMLTMNSLGDGSTLSLDFTTMGGVLDPRLTFSRASTATFVNSSGYVEYAGANLITYSNAFASGSWYLGGTPATLTPNYAVGPDGITGSAWRFQGALSNSVFAQPISNNGVAHVVSIYAKSNTGSNQTFTIYNGASGTTCTATSVWQRFEVPVAGTWAYAYFGTLGTSQDILIWGAQSNLGSTAQTYYPTTTAAYYAPRFDYSPTNIGEPRGLLIEGQTTNVALNSNAIGNAGGLTRTYPTGVISPDGTENAQRFTKTDATTPRYIYPTTSFTVPASTAYTASIWIKYDGYAFTTQIQSDTAMDWGGAWTAAFVIASGGITVGSRTGICSASTVTAYPNGWYRCTATITTGAAPTGSNPRFLIDVVGTTGVTVLVYGLQLEAAAGASSYIPTGASGVTRNADDCYVSGSNFTSWFDSTQGTLLVTARSGGNYYDTSAYDFAAVLTQSGVGTDHIGCAQWSSGLFGVVRANNTYNLNYTSLGSLTAPYKTAIAYAVSDFAAVANNGTVTTGTGSLPLSINRMRIGGNRSGSAAAGFSGTIANIKFFPTRLPNAQLKTITTL